VDETIEQKINVVSLNNTDYKLSNDQQEKIQYHDIIENQDELIKIILRLRCSKSLDSKCTEDQDEFNYIKQLNKELNIQSKEDYSDIAIENKHKMYIKNPEEYFNSKGVWTNWYDFMGINTKIFIQDKNDWIIFCKDKNIESLDDYYELCKKHSNLPNEPIDFYKNFSNINYELKINKERR